MLKCAANATDKCFYSGQFRPNGTLSADEWLYFALDLRNEDFPSNAGLTARLVQMAQDCTFKWYLQQDDFPSASDFAVGASAAYQCQQGQKRCPGVVPPSIGVCNSDKTWWYLGVNNVGNTSGDFMFQVEVILDIGKNQGCPEEWWTLGIVLAVILVPTLSILCVFGIVCFVVGYCTRRGETAAQHGQSMASTNSWNQATSPMSANQNVFAFQVVPTYIHQPLASSFRATNQNLNYGAINDA